MHKQRKHAYLCYSIFSFCCIQNSMVMLSNSEAHMPRWSSLLWSSLSSSGFDCSLTASPSALHLAAMPGIGEHCGWGVLENVLGGGGFCPTGTFISVWNLLQHHLGCHPPWLMWISLCTRHAAKWCHLRWTSLMVSAVHAWLSDFYHFLPRPNGQLAVMMRENSQTRHWAVWHFTWAGRMCR